ncbi:MAG TPA: bifunctional 5,10-methylene-tetrahydrofolate dehydrogenase/5,10-methylene-tetrahydrofolate cyclohydrolase [Verrucomicrobia subdivision 6 bacterium]|jgi:methylenetetrahydrofolate dehydrogenase (NADP+) / methenyltetrahydrofolate cyclohydrolase|uniref:Bifunctional protein FolD n=3 Tax=Verrucomicrobia subdivision 6 TaxID=134627 RepID=A0A0R2RJ80_9BACT|nr:MAG: bifunctional 5,10-methylene-tetrahydrofolate dehydrogenase/5,10-methylene-tetrahydrofolate cyclohydrolase [Verrucomicrobia subdivision 6 bacterium BACL9 MAG-120507-bin52]KRP32735.1 MAG: bifunctional 5,10-methylene-tetrahydrofolate dehydrogenase/5,10-methylene-tetrahydrofolate cyclohydrolase [Verrucomicrobia subdivision 6 bacterium BACL9 MAG-120924-bin69]MDA0324110.1 bifunctional 5,10-methylenetetrahydrofolate dehydrogenase/5,10-methenyltetrahydrofolate cyclohydrolase [Verrucomicrobiota ba
MSTRILDGEAFASQIHRETASRVVALSKRGITPRLVFIRVGEDPASRAYVSRKETRAKEVGLTSETIVLPETITLAQLLAQIDALNADPKVHGILIQSPLPSALPNEQVYARVSPAKDVDGFHPVNFGKLLLGDPTGFLPCTPAGIMEILRLGKIPTRGKHAVVVGRGQIVGRPLAVLLARKSTHADCTVTLAHSSTPNLPSITRQADILIGALGRPLFLTQEHVQPGATVIDVGVNRIPDTSSPRGYRLVGDVDFASVQPVAGAITPNPGGVGPMTIALLLSNTLRAAEDTVS